MAFGPPMPNVNSAPAPLELQEVYYQWQPEPDQYLFCAMFPDRMYSTPSINFDLAGGAEGALNDGFLDQTPSPQPGRKRATVSLAPLFKDRLEELRHSDAVNTRALGALDEINPEQQATLMSEECAIATWTQREIDTIAAISGTITPSLFGASGATYSYGVQTMNCSTDTAKGASGHYWSDLTNANVIGDLIAGAMLMRGYGYEPRIYYNAKVGGKYIAQNSAIVNLAKQSGFADQIGPGGSVGQIMNDGAVNSLLKSFTGIAGGTSYDMGYRTLNRTTGVYTFIPFLADNQLIMVGQPFRNQPKGWVGFAPTANRGSLLDPKPGPWLRTFDQSTQRPNGGMQVYAGYFGIPALPFPEIFINYTVA